MSPFPLTKTASEWCKENIGDNEMKAKFIKDVSKDFNGTAKVFELDPALDGNKYVVVSATNVMFSGPETYIFAYDLDNGQVSNWSDLEGSFRGSLDIEKALNNAGYTVEK